jgi:signal transduction histidine kinase
MSIMDTTHPLATDPAGLQRIIDAFNEAAVELQETHENLRGEVMRLREELSAANARLRRSQELAALGEMAAGIAHEIRNPLGSIRLYAEALAEDLADRPAERELCEKISRGVVGLDAIVRDVLAFARDHRPDPVAVPMGRLLRGAIDQCEGIIARSGMRIDDDGGIEADTVHADPVLLVQAVSNVIRNAIEAMDASLPAGDPDRVIHAGITRRRLRLPGGGSGERIVLEIRDHGPGIPAEVRDRMFNPFFTTRATGTGLGLAIVHRIIDAHGGHVIVEDAPGGGARVGLCLPPVACASPSNGEMDAPLIEHLSAAVPAVATGASS